jgi:hypothetical protein
LATSLLKVFSFSYLSAVIHEADYRLFELQQKHAWSRHLVDDVLTYARFLQALSMSTLGAPDSLLPELVPMRESSAKSIASRVKKNESAVRFRAILFVYYAVFVSNIHVLLL